MGQFDVLLKPFHLKHLTIRNRVVSTSHSPAYGVDGKPKERYQAYHEEKAKGGIGMTMVGGSSNVSPDSAVSSWALLYLGDDSIIPYFKQLVERVHRHGAKIMCQVTHQGRRNHWDTGDWLPIISASGVPEPQHNDMPKAMEEWDIHRVIEDFGQAARRCREGGLDGIEVNAPGPHLISQFLSPSVNCRTDEYGGSLDNRMRFALEVLARIRAEVGNDYVVGFRMSGDELIEGGLNQDDCIEIARRLAESGLVDFLTVNGASSRDYVSGSLHVPGMALPVSPFLHLASGIKAAVDIPIIHAQRQLDLATAARAVTDGHLDLVGMTRPHFTDPHLMNKLKEGRVDEIRQCVGANYCIDRLFTGGESLCIHNAATGREMTMPHTVRRAGERKRVIVVGAGPAGLEAARVCAERGHEVVLFESQPRVGGQINIATRLAWREALSGIVRWFEIVLKKHAVDMRLGQLADAAAIESTAPDIVVIATGGAPDLGAFEGHDLAVSTWDVLVGKVELQGSVLIYDRSNQQHGVSCAEFLANKGALVEIVTHERRVAAKLGPTNFAVHLRNLYEKEAVLTPDMVVTRAYREGAKIIAVLRNEYTKREEEREVDHLVSECGTRSRDDLYFQLKPNSRNLGEIDPRALIEGRAQDKIANADGRFRLFRVGDAVAGRNIHASIYDSLRLCKDF